jgi:NodT family efflux transporter outer membrane factor (OMF) lipoprotein
MIPVTGVYSRNSPVPEKDCGAVCERKRSVVLRLLMTGLLITCLAACALTSEEVKPLVAAPAHFSASGTEPLARQWWLSLEDPALNELMDQALAGNLNLKSAWARLTQAEAVARQAGAEMFPSIDAEAAAARTAVRQDGNRDYTSTFSLGLVAGYELDLWGRIRSLSDAALLDVRAREEDILAAAVTLSAQVASTWYELAEQYEQLEILDGQITTNAQVLELVTERFRSGQAGAADVLQQRQLVESIRGERIQTEAGIKVLDHRLAILLGRPPDQQVAPQAAGLVDTPPLPQTGLPVELIRRRPDLRSAYFDLLSADRRVAAAAADLFPRISLTAQVNTSGEHVRELFDNWLANLAANLTAPIIDGGRRRAEVDRTRAVALEKLQDYSQAVLEALGEVEDALAKEQRQREFVASLDRQLGLSGMAIERVRDRYRQGAENYLRVLTSLLTHQRLQRDRLTASRELIQYRIDLCRALGGGWTIRKPELSSTRGKKDRTLRPRS